ncbi:unnamed protein product, partial [Enterobius vermicularis]|uniref:4-nitrophenylphosphatase n=1 Tax=Enterobius vermicularis TaxID=51028 RepID=A0A0N4VFW0_ENTVE
CKTKLCRVCNSTIIDNERELPTFPSQLSSDLVEDLLVNVDAFIFDADGVLWLGNTPIPGSPEFIKYLLSKVWLLSYLWSISGSKFFAVLAVAEKCLSFVNGGDVVNPAAIVSDLIKKNQLLRNKSVYLIGSEGLRSELKKAGVDCFGSGPDPMHDKDFDDDKRDVGAVIVGFEKYFNYVKMIKAANYLQNEDCLFFGTNEDETSPGPYPNTVIPDTGPILTAVKSASGRQPLVVGKPHAPAFEYISRRWNLKPDRTFMVGDRLNTDICFGKRNGLKTLLVLSGCHTLSELSLFRESGNVDMVPDFYATSLGSLVGFS